MDLIYILGLFKINIFLYVLLINHFLLLFIDSLDLPTYFNVGCILLSLNALSIWDLRCYF